MEIILKIAGLITSLGTIVGMFIALYKIARTIETTNERINENTMYTLKLVIMNTELSLEERISAGDKYIKLGGNGYVKHIYEELLKQIEVK